MNPKSPCLNCPDRQPGCHDPGKCEPWAEYEAACKASREARAKYMNTWCYDSGRDKAKTIKLKKAKK